MPFGGTLDSDNRWVLFSSLMPWEALEETYAPQFNPTTGAPAKPVRLAFGALFIKQRLGLTDEETVEQILEDAYMQFSLGFTGYLSKTPFAPSMMVHFRKPLSEEDLNRITELIVEHGKAMVMEALASTAEESNSHDPGANAANQLSLDDLVKPADWPEDNTRSIHDSIVNLVQRQVRLIACGKARASLEFGALARRASACGRSAFL